MRTNLLLCSLLAGLAAPGALHAQGQRRGLGRGQGNSFTVTVLSGLDFGAVVAGAPVTVPATGATAAKFEVAPPRGGGAMVTFTLPPSLTSGAATLPIEFDATSGAWAETTATAGATYFDPRQTQVTMPKNAIYYFWIGGRVTPGPSQPAGSYTGVITLSAVVN